MVAGSFISHHERISMGGNSTYVCQNPGSINSKGIWMQQNPLQYTTPLILLQFSVISITSLLIDLCLKPLGQSTIVSQILGGIVYGPSLLGHEDAITSTMFPPRGAMAFNTISTFGLMFFLFAIGVKMDPRMMVRPGRKAVLLGTSVMFFTLTLTLLLALVLKKYLPMDASLAKAITYIAMSQCLTAFPNIACLLAELKILNTDLGRMAISIAMFCDIIGISLTAVGFSLLQTMGGGSHVLPSIYSILSLVVFLVIIIYIFRPAILWTLSRIPEGKPVGEGFICSIFTSVLIVGFLSEMIGQHFVLGPLILGLVVPDGPPLGAALVSKLDSLASGLLYPAFLTSSGLKMNIFKVDFRSTWIVGLIVLFASLVKIGAVMLPARYCKISPREALVIGLMLNARGICELIVFNLWMNGEVLTAQEFALSVIFLIGVTAIITPLIKILYNPSDQHVLTQRRTIQHAKRDTELRIMVCIHNQDSVPSIVNLLEASNATDGSPIGVIAVLLVELVGRTTPILIAHPPQQTLENNNTSTSGHIINAFRQYELHNQGFVTVQSFTAISYFDTMHDDITRVALDQNATIVIMPFHKRWEIDGSVSSMNRAIQAMNLKVLDQAPCSVGILIDRGMLSGTVSIINNHLIYQVAVLYISGADDGEALFYGARMARHENVALTIIRFLLFGSDNARERKYDNDLIDEVRQSNLGNEDFSYQEVVVRDGVGLVACIRGLEDCFDLMIVGRYHQQSSPLLLGLEAWSECPELGVIGDILASPDFGRTASVLVVQQQRVGGMLINRNVRPVVNDRDPVLNSMQRQSAASTSGGDNNATWNISIDRGSRD